MTGAGLNAAVAMGGMSCDSVVVAATDEALEVSMVTWATARVAAATRPKMALACMAAMMQK